MKGTAKIMLIAAVLTGCLGLALVATLLISTTDRQQRWPLVAAFFCMLPMSWLMYHGVRMPLDALLRVVLGESPWLNWLRTVYAPLTEEPIKLAPLLLPLVRRALTQGPVERVALAVGCGFAMGEIYTVEELIEAARPEVAKLPWYELQGFINERLMTFATHSSMAAVSLIGAQRGFRWGCLGLVGAMVIHFVSNFPIFMAQRGWFGTSDPGAINQLLAGWVMLCCLASVIWLSWRFRQSILRPSAR